MTTKEEEHLTRIKILFNAEVDRKFRIGAAEHIADGPLEDNCIEELVDFALAEAIDQVTYLLTLKEKVRGTKKL